MKKLTTLLSAAMLISFAANTNCEIISRDGDVKNEAVQEVVVQETEKECQCEKCVTQREEDKANHLQEEAKRAELEALKEAEKAEKEVKRAEQEALEKSRKETAKEIHENLFDTTEAVTLEVKYKNQYMGVALRNEDKASYEVSVYNLDTKERIVFFTHENLSKYLRSFSVAQDTITLKWKGLLRKQTTYTLVAQEATEKVETKENKCKTCGHVTQEEETIKEDGTICKNCGKAHIGAIVKKAALWGLLPIR